MTKRDLPIREFAYINKERLEDFVSPLLGGIPVEHREATQDNGAQTEGGINVHLASIQVTGPKQLMSWEEVRQATPASLFEMLLGMLKENDALQELSAFDDAIWDQLEEREFVIARCETQLSALDRMFDLFRRFANMMAVVSPDQLKGSEQALQYVEALSTNETINVRLTPIGSPSPRHIFVVSLDAANVRLAKPSLEGRLEILGRVQKKLVRGETFELFNLVPEGLRLPREQLREMIDSFRDMPPILGEPPKMEDLRVSYPAIVLTPVALFR